MIMMKNYSYLVNRQLINNNYKFYAQIIITPLVCLVSSAWCDDDM